MNETTKPMAISLQPTGPSPAASASRLSHSSSVVAPIIVGTARKKLNSAAVRRSMPIASAPMIVAPERLMPGIIDTHCARPTPSACLSGNWPIPGISRSGATIMGALAMGIERRTAAEFSFFLAVPTMLGASTLELLDNRAALATAGGVGWTQIAIGFVVAFVVALAVIKVFVAYVSRAGFAPFAWYRIVAGIAAIAWLMLRTG